MSEPVAKNTNRLIDATSPYLLQHAHNPVDWYPWGEEALSRARAEDKPILLSIGYSACHWCHVMERESFENEAIAELMNRHFVCIKVDREERPDLDDVYMAATLAMNHGQGGWPMTVFLTPEQQPFFAGTYFPPEDRWGRPGFTTVLERIAELWRSDRPSAEAQGAQLVDYLRENTRSAPGGTVGEEALRAAAEQLARAFDARWGGFGPAPKFPPSASLSLLLRCHRRFGDEPALGMVRQTLDGMARGGMYDQVGGGFARYSTDERWLVPHFEKMLYDNAQLARAYLEAYTATGDDSYRRIARETLDYVRREMTAPAGGFYSATDADSEGEEGKFFVWTPAEVRDALGPDDEELARRFCAYYDITEKGNWEGKSIPNTPRSLDDVAREVGVPPEELRRSLESARARLYEARSRRVPPGLDDKVLTAWNGLMISAFAEGARVLGEDRDLEDARRAADFLLAALRRPDGRLWRTWRAGRAHVEGYLEDYAFLIEALVDVYEAGGAEGYLQEAERLAEKMREDFAAEEGGFFSTARGHESLIVRPREGHDGAIPSANAAAALGLARLSHHLDRADLREDAGRAVRAWGKAIARQPRSFAKSLAVVDFLLEGPVELAFVGRRGEPGFEALRREVGRRYLPNRIVAHYDPSAGPPSLPLLQGKTLVDGRAALYVCRDYACQRPVTEASKAGEALASRQPASEAGSTPPPLGEARLAGAATAEATSAYARRQRAGETGYGPLGRTGATCSRIGFGGYRVDDETPEHREALRRALLSGSNLIDTSTNYTDGGSERLVGEVVADLVRQGRLRREEVIVVSKIGYVQGANLELARSRETQGRPFPEMVKYGEGVWHCMHPEFLADQLPRSLARLQLETLDACLLHNPEYYLSDAHERSDGALERRREEFYRRLQEAFVFLEAEAAGGRIRVYGVSSNTCTRPAGDPEFTSLTRMLVAAEAAGGAGHHFRVLQLPLNLIESGAALEKNNGADLDRTVLESAAERGIAVLVNRPLNAIVDEGMLRLASVSPGAQETELEEQFAIVAAREAEFRRDIAGKLQTSDSSLPPENLFRWSADLRGASAHVRGLDHWQALESQRILPRLLQVVQVLDQSLTGRVAQTWQSWRSRYLPELQKLLGELRRQAALKSQAAVTGVAAAVDPLLPAERRGESLSRKALWVVASTPGVSCVLSGMRSTDYVDDALGILAWPPLDDPRDVYEAVRKETKPSGG